MLGENNLEYISIGDVLLGFGDHLEEALTFDCGRGENFLRLAALVQRGGTGLSQGVVHVIDSIDCVVVVALADSRGTVNQCDDHDFGAVVVKSDKVFH